MPRYTEEEARAAVAAATNYSEAMRLLRMRPHGGNHRLFRRYVDEVWRIPTDHFDPNRARMALLRREPTPLEEVLVQKSGYSRTKLKQRLYSAGLKQPVCEMCGQDEMWNGRRMSLILDHINGVSDDNRIENLRIVCPNCAATLETHCGKQNRRVRPERLCELCGRPFWPKYDTHRFCSQDCGQRSPGKRGSTARRKVERPPHEQLVREVAEAGWSAVGRRYGVSDNAVRKWVRAYEAELELEREREAA